MIDVKFDRPKLEKSLQNAAKNFGESSKQAVTRWGVQVCREMAVETQAWGKSGTKKKQEAAILSGARAVFHILDGEKNRRRLKKRKNELSTPEEINAWIDENRSDEDGRTRRLPPEERKEVTLPNLIKALRVRNAAAGMAKGGWLGAGMEIARAQTGQGRINIGKNFLGYAQKHSRKGNAQKPISPFRPVATLNNTMRHSGKSNVISNGATAKAIGFGLRKTIQWYRKAAKQSLDKA